MTHEGVNSISGVCESVDKKQNLSVFIAQIRWHPQTSRIDTIFLSDAIKN